MQQPFRERLDTGCTRDSKDSGIDLRRRRVRRGRPAAALKELREEQEEPAGRQAQIDASLWGLAFLLTVFFFKLPISVWFSHKVDWNWLSLSLAAYVVWLFCGAYMLREYRSTKLWAKKNTQLFFFAWTVFAIGHASFCVGTWALFGFWSIYIVGVTFAFVFSLASLI